jgi:drug/metabolite transporter (DMT)-like permease
MSQRWVGGANLPGIRGTSTSRYIALVAVLTALFTAYGYVSSIELRPVTRSLDLFFLLPAFFAILVSLTGKKWGGTILAAVIGLIFLGTPSAAGNFSPHITASVIVNGLVFDLYLQRSGGSLLDPSRKHLVLAGTLGNLLWLLPVYLYSRPWEGHHLLRYGRLR